MALTRAHELQQQGDLEGSQVWRQLADEIEHGGTSAGPLSSYGAVPSTRKDIFQITPRAAVSRPAPDRS
jgi:hypothetical protein